MKIKNSICTALLTACAIPALANDNPWYVGIAAHQFELDPGDTTFRQPPQGDDSAVNFNFNSDIDGGTGAGLLVGWDPTAYSLRLEFEYRLFSSDIEEFGTSESGQVFTGKAKAHQLLSMFWFEFPSFWRFTPYVGAGFGFAQVELDEEKGETNVMGQWGLGLSYDLLDSLTVDLGYRSFSTDSLDYGRSSGQRPLVTTEYKGETLNLGLRWYWDRQLKD